MSRILEEEDDAFNGKEIVHFGDKIVVLKTSFFDEDVDTDRLLKIDSTNLLAEILTFNVIVNRLGIALAHAEQKLNLAKMNYDIMEAKEKDSIRQEAADEIEAGLRKKAITVDEVNSTFVKSGKYRDAVSKTIEAEKNRDVLNSLFWSAKAKAAVLEKLSMTIKPEDITGMVTTSIHGIELKVKERRIK